MKYLETACVFLWRREGERRKENMKLGRMRKRKEGTRKPAAWNSMTGGLQFDKTMGKRPVKKCTQRGEERRDEVWETCCKYASCVTFTLPTLDTTSSILWVYREVTPLERIAGTLWIVSIHILPFTAYKNERVNRARSTRYSTARVAVVLAAPSWGISWLVSFQETKRCHSCDQSAAAHYSSS